MKYLVCKKQVDGGYRFDWVEALSIKDAIEQTIWPNGKDEYCAAEGENRLETILVIPAERVAFVDIAAIVDLQRKEKEEEQRKKELAELERLRRKYGV